MTGAKAIGGSGGNLAYAGVKKSVAIKFDLYNSAGEGPNSTGLFLNGAQPEAVNSINLTGTGIDLHSGHVFNVLMDYDGTTLKVTIIDTDGPGRKPFTLFESRIPVPHELYLAHDTLFAFTGGATVEVQLELNPAGSGALIGRQALKSSAPTTSGELKKNPKEMNNNASEDRVVSNLSPRKHSIRLGFCIRYGNPSQE